MTILKSPPMPTGVAGRLRWTAADGWTLVWRGMRQLKSEPGQIVGGVVASAVLVLVFGFVFGSAIAVPGGGNYREYLLPGLFGMVAVTSVMLNAASIAKEKSKGVVDRFRSMPMARLAVPFGQAGYDVVFGVIGLLMTVACGLVVGWRAHEGVARTAAAFGLIILFRYAMSWLGVYIGLAVKHEKTLDTMGPLIFPAIIISNAFVPTDNMAPWLRTIADWNPVSTLIQACRVLFGNPGAGLSHGTWPLQHPVLATVLWSAGLIVVFAALSGHRYVTAES